MQNHFREKSLSIQMCYLGDLIIEVQNPTVQPIFSYPLKPVTHGATSWFKQSHDTGWLENKVCMY